MKKDQMMEEIQNKYFFSGALKLLSRRPRTNKEIVDWLNKKEASEDVQKDILQKLVKLKLLDDLAYAESFIRTRVLLKHRSVRVLKIELAQKGISKDLIEKALLLNEVDEKKAAQELIRKNIWKWKRYDTRTRKRKIHEFLSRKGFTFDVISALDYNILE